MSDRTRQRRPWVILALALAVAIGGTSSRGDAAAAAPAACEWDAQLFPANRENLPDPERWAELYHAAAKAAVDAHVARPPASACTSGTAQRPTRELAVLAARIPPWRGNAAALADLRESDMGGVLLEHLRLYECALRRAQAFIATDVAQAVGAIGAGPLNGAVFAVEARRRQDLIRQELFIARATLHRALIGVSGADRLLPVTGGLACVARASLDLRNAFGLAAEASSCLLRPADARGSLRSLPISYP